MAFKNEFASCEYITVEELALVTGVSASTWNKRRLTGDSPPFFKIGRSVRYKRDDVEEWLGLRSMTSTSTKVSRA